MFFNNLIVFKLPLGWGLSAEETSKKLASMAFKPCGASDPFSLGWVPPCPNGELVHVVNKQFLLSLKREEKMLPGKVVNKFLEERIETIENQEGRKVGRKEKRDLKEAITEELRPRAFTADKHVEVWIDPVNNWLCINATSISKGEEVLEFLRKSIDPSPKVGLLQTITSPSAAMSTWLATKEEPAGFSIDQDLELCSAEQAKVHYVKHSLDSDEISEHIAGGKVATKLAMTWQDRISFVLTQNLQIKKVSFLDILKESTENQAENAEEKFDLDFTLMTGELAKLLDDVLAALGGELKKD